MARPQKEGLDYFPHDTDASSDEKIEALRALYGNDGYAFYFILLERIYRTPVFEINISDAETIQILAKKTAVSPEKFEQMLNTALKWGCFDQKSYEERGVLTSNGIKKRASIVTKKREEMREKYQQTKDKKGKISDAETNQDTHQYINQEKNQDITQETQPETPQSKVKESKDIYNNNSNAREENCKAIQAALEKAGILLPSAYEIDSLLDWIDKGVDVDAILYAIQKSALAGQRRVDYINGTISKWLNAGIKTQIQAEAEQLLFQKRKKSLPKGREPTGDATLSGDGRTQEQKKALIKKLY